jgi:hypothetical protein
MSLIFGIKFSPFELSQYAVFGEDYNLFGGVAQCGEAQGRKRSATPLKAAILLFKNKQQT